MYIVFSFEQSQPHVLSKLYYNDKEHFSVQVLHIICLFTMVQKVFS